MYKAIETGMEISKYRIWIILMIVAKLGKEYGSQCPFYRTSRQQSMTFHAISDLSLDVSRIATNIVFCTYDLIHIYLPIGEYIVHSGYSLLQCVTILINLAHFLHGLS